MDSGWYGTAKYWWTQVSDWDVNEEKFPGGHRLEPSWMALASQASFSDAHETKAMPLCSSQ